MPICRECNREFKVLNSNHLAQHGLTLQDYINKYGEDPNKSSLGGSRTKASASSVVKKTKEKSENELSTKQTRTIEDLFELENTVVIPENFQWVDQTNKELLDKVIDLIYEYGEVSVDTETTGLDPFSDRVTHIILTPHDPGRKYNILIPLYHEDREGHPMPNLLPTDYVVSKIKPILEDPNIRTDWFNLYFDGVMLFTSFGIKVANIVPEKYLPKLVNGRMTYRRWDPAVDKWTGGWDSSPTAHILNENEPSNKLKDLYAKYVFKSETDPAIQALGFETFEEQFGDIRFYRVPKKVATAYGAKDGYITRRMREFQEPYVNSTGDLANILYTIEFPLIKPLYEMRIEGIRANLDTAKKIGDELEIKRAGALEKVRAVVGDINLNSPKQVSHALYEKLGLPDLDKGSTKSAVLEELAELGYDVASDLIAYKKAEKLKSSFIDTAPDMLLKDGKVHCIFNALGARTGRFSCSHPNLQQVPAKFGVVRTMFEAEKGDLLLGADLSQIEPRLTAHTCNDKSMIETYLNGQDLYSMMAAKVFTLLAKKTAGELDERRRSGHFNPGDPAHGMAPIRQQLVKDGFAFLKDDVFCYKPLEPTDCYDGTLYRKMAKTLLLGMTYGMTSKGLASRLKLSDADAEGIIEDFFTSFPSIKAKMKELHNFASVHGYVETEFGRKRRIPEIWDDNRWVRMRAERQLFNSAIQGGAADVMKILMNCMFYDPRLKELRVKVLLTVHDEVIASCPRENAVVGIKTLVSDMTQPLTFKVPIKADGEIYLSGKWNDDSVSYKGSDFEFEKNKLTEDEVSKMCLNS